MAFKLFVLAAVLAVANAGYLGGYAAAPVAAYGYAAHAAPAYGYAAHAPAAITSQHSNILRTPGNLGQISTYSKSIDTAFSSVRKSDVRVSNDALAYHAAPAVAAYHVAPAVAAYHAPAIASYAAPAITSYAAPAVRTLAAPALASYAAPYASAYAAPAAYGIAAHGFAAHAPAAITSQHSNILRTPGNLGQVSTYSKTIDTPFSSVRKSDVRVSNDALAYHAAPAVAAYHAPAVAAYAAPYAHAYGAPAVAAHGLLGVAYSAAPAVAHMTYSNAYGLNYAY